jgi:hypothetical protein
VTRSLGQTLLLARLQEVVPLYHFAAQDHFGAVVWEAIEAMTALHPGPDIRGMTRVVLLTVSEVKIHPQPTMTFVDVHHNGIAFGVGSASTLAL